MAASERSKLKRVPFHPFAALFDTATLSGLAYGQTGTRQSVQKQPEWNLTIVKHTQRFTIQKLPS